MDNQFKTLSIDFSNQEDRNAMFDKICELRCLNIQETKKKMAVKGNGDVSYAKLIELCNNQNCEMKIWVAVELKPAVGVVTQKSPESIRDTEVDTIIPPTKNQSIDAGFSVEESPVSNQEELDDLF